MRPAMTSWGSSLRAPEPLPEADRARRRNCHPPRVDGPPCPPLPSPPAIPPTRPPSWPSTAPGSRRPRSTYAVASPPRSASPSSAPAAPARRPAPSPAPSPRRWWPRASPSGRAAPRASTPPRTRRPSTRGARRCWSRGVGWTGPTLLTIAGSSSASWRRAARCWRGCRTGRRRWLRGSSSATRCWQRSPPRPSSSRPGWPAAPAPPPRLPGGWAAPSAWSRTRPGTSRARAAPTSSPGAPRPSTRRRTS